MDSSHNLKLVGGAKQPHEARAWGGVGGDLKDDHAVLQRVCRLLERIERRTGTGVLTYWREHVGRAHIVMENRRVCLVAAQPSVFNLLEAADPEVSQRLSQLRAQARREKRRFGELVLEQDSETSAAIIRRLRQQSTAAIITIAEAHIEDEADIYTGPQQGAYRWGSGFLPAVGDYDRRLTFSPLEIYQTAAELLGPPPDNELAATLFDELRDDCRCALLLWTNPNLEATSLPVRFKTPQLASVADLRKLAFSADALCRPSSLRAAGYRPDFIAFGAVAQEQLVVFSEHYIAFLAGSDPGARARVASRVFGAVDRRSR